MMDHRHALQSLVTALTRAASHARSVLLRVRHDLAVWSDVRSFPALALLAGLDCVAVLILWRGRAGGLPPALTNARLCIAALGAAALTAGSRWFLARIEREKPALWIRSLLAALSVLPLVALLTLANSRNSPWAISLVSALAVTVGNVNLLWTRRSIRHAAFVKPSPPRAVILPFPVASPAVEFSKSGRVGDQTDRDTAVGAIRRADEWIERTTDPVAGVACRGQTIAHFADRQSVVTVHIPFVPAFDRVPEFACDVVDDPSIRARAPAVYRYGARVELKRTGDVSTTARASVRFEARDPAQSSRAA